MVVLFLVEYRLGYWLFSCVRSLEVVLFKGGRKIFDILLGEVVDVNMVVEIDLFFMLVILFSIFLEGFGGEDWLLELLVS